jgi:PAS domain S-box-containing protein
MKDTLPGSMRDSPLRSSSGPSHARIWGIFLGISLCLLAAHATPGAPTTKNVLILFSSVEKTPYLTDVLEPAIRNRLKDRVNFQTSYLTHSQDPDREKHHEQSLAETMRRQYAGIKLDLVIAVAPQALLFSIEYRDKIFPGTPIVFTQVGTRQFQGKSWPGVTGLTVRVGIGETIDLALRLHPDATTVALIDGPDWYWIDVTKSELARYRDRVKEVLFTDPPSSDLLARVRQLPPHTVVLFFTPLPDASDPEFGARDLLAGVTSRWPTYSAWPENCLGHDCIGGAYPDLKKEHLETAQIAARVLAGERPEDIPIQHDSSLQVQVDWRQLQRWHISDSTLPPDSVVLNREPTFWQRYRNLVLAAIFVILAQAFLIAALLWQRARKQKAEAILRESEERFRVLANTAPALIWMFDTQGNITYLNDRRSTFTGQDAKAGFGDTWTAFVHPDDLQGLQEAVAAALKADHPFAKEYRLKRNDGVYRWMFGVAAQRKASDGSIAGLIGSSIDITDQKVARETLRNLSGHLIEAQEKERARIARELHDDVCQRLALLSLELGQAVRTSRGSSGNLQHIQKECQNLATDVQALSHRLHSSRLDFLGIVPALKGFCREFSQQFHVNVDFTSTDVPGNISKDASLCLFRVAQEALHNAVKYSGTRTFRVELTATSHQVRLEMNDWGSGFNVEKARRSSGLGLVSMEERVRLVRGTFSIASRPGEGTRIAVVVPLPAAVETPPPADQGIATTETVAG